MPKLVLMIASVLVAGAIFTFVLLLLWIWAAGLL